MNIEAMKQALGVLEADEIYVMLMGANGNNQRNAASALRQAIEQAEYNNLTVKFGERAKEYLEGAKKSWQEPVDIHCPSCLHSFVVMPVAKREWVGLTDEEMTKIASKTLTFKQFVEIIEAKLKDKNNAR